MIRKRNAAIVTGSIAATIGLLAAPLAVEAATVLTVSDGVIRNSLCVGGDCANNPSYGDSTLILTENNTRIKFADTSVAASFPNRDWEIQANSNSNGGANYLGFNDCGTAANVGGCAEDLVFAVEGGAPLHALYVDSQGDVGVGTNTPVLDIHAAKGDTPAIRLEQNGTSGFTPQTWDIAGNESSFFVRDATNGSTLPFRIFPGAPSSALTVEASGDIGVGTNSPSAEIDIVRTDGRAQIRLHSAGDGIWNMFVDADSQPSPGLKLSKGGSGFNEFILNDGALQLGHAPPPAGIVGQIYFDGDTVCVHDGASFVPIVASGNQTCN